MAKKKSTLTEQIESLKSRIQHMDWHDFPKRLPPVSDYYLVEWHPDSVKAGALRMGIAFYAHGWTSCSTCHAFPFPRVKRWKFICLKEQDVFV